jgi:hypothetical protein
MRELVIPPAAQRDSESVEIIRGWVAEGAQWVSLNSDLFENRDFKEEWAWGMFLADTLRHLGNSISLRTGKDQSEIFEEIKTALLEELEKPTSTARGGHIG